MLAGGLGNIRAGHVQKREIPDGAAIVVLAGGVLLRLVPGAGGVGADEEDDENDEHGEAEGAEETPGEVAGA